MGDKAPGDPVAEEDRHMGVGGLSSPCSGDAGGSLRAVSTMSVCLWWAGPSGSAQVVPPGHQTSFLSSQTIQQDDKLLAFS